MRVYSIPLVISLSFILFSADSPKLRTETSNSFNPFREKAAAARAYAHQHGLSTAVCFLADMQLPSGQNRFFVYDLAGDSVRGSGLVTHGRCNESWLEGRRYGNVPGCGCTSLGKYRVGLDWRLNSMDLKKQMIRPSKGLLSCIRTPVYRGSPLKKKFARVMAVQP